MGKPGVIAFPVLLALGAITGYLAYDLLVVNTTPVPGNYEHSPYYQELATATPIQDVAPTQRASAKEPVSDNVVTILMLKGSAVQGADAYDPDPAIVPLDATIRWVNEDTVIHTATYGTGFSDRDFGLVFDTKFVDAGKEYRIAASEIGPGEYTYFCLAHPYMIGTLIIQ